MSKVGVFSSTDLRVSSKLVDLLFLSLRFLIFVGSVLSSLHYDVAAYIRS